MKRVDYSDEYKLEPTVKMIIFLSLCCFVGFIGDIVSGINLFGVMWKTGLLGLILIGVVGSFVDL